MGLKFTLKLGEGLARVSLLHYSRAVSLGPTTTPLVAKMLGNFKTRTDLTGPYLDNLEVPGDHYQLPIEPKLQQGNTKKLPNSITDPPNDSLSMNIH